MGAHSYYGLEDVDQDSVNTFLSQLVEESLTELERSGCVEVLGDGECQCLGGEHHDMAFNH